MFVGFFKRAGDDKQKRDKKQEPIFVDSFEVRCRFFFFFCLGRQSRARVC
jgi:hypothetical protein